MERHQSLTQELLAMQEASTKKIPAEKLALMEQAIKELRESEAAKGLPVGEKAPDFTLPNASGINVHLYEELAKGPVVLSFYRGGWCPYCNLELRAYQRALEKIQAEGAQLIAISPDLPDETMSTQEKNELRFHVLSDVGGKVSTDYRLTYQLPDYLVELYKEFGIDLPKKQGVESWQLPISGTFVINPEGFITLANVEADYKKRLDPEEVIRELKNM
ncbi:peroxiredoxin-like family protein [Aneurinibacillus sp. Ricciae_BoGa-3]|uniref:peroxiredoxin-like family protein n=1 Tax=Aneurinibacillus sp. Ricciae_BoGa-3 TaxID=3022697 RepID=UPI002340884A|nr:peroxiredoxin-like family protein [Aneurinibacillus sp. Ricciae_BoGa-3]WCK52942.1 peroxiredoxin-like family protein [Aneurinibacillus sp. Ricciae_BoGa-3]